MRKTSYSNTLDKYTRSLLLGSVIGVLITFSNCAKVNFSHDDNKDKVGTFVCDPFGGGPGNPTQGLIADLYYFDAFPGYPMGQFVGNYTPPQAIKASQKIFLNSLNVPTRPWESGFQTGNGNLLKKSNGDTLVEWFRLSLKTNIKLAPGDAAGNYQFATLSDDGLIMTTDQYGQILSNDNVHPTRFTASPGVITFDNSTRLKSQIDWFQGPRVKIALMLLWRPISAAAADPSEGLFGDDYWFDLSGNPTQNYQDLLARGWRPLRPENFEIPAEDGGANPCF